MKQSSNVSHFFTYLVDRPFKCLIVLLLSFTSFIAIDQTYLSGKEVTALPNESEMLLTKSEMALGTIYIGWVSANPDLIRSYKNSKTSLVSFSISDKVEGVKYALQNCYKYLEIQASLAKRIIYLFKY